MRLYNRPARAQGKFNYFANRINKRNLRTSMMFMYRGGRRL